MAKIKFERTSAPTGLVTFTENPSYGGSDPLRFLQPQDRSVGNVLYSYNKGINEQTYHLVWDFISETCYQNMLTFFRDVVNGASYSFTYTDAAGVAHANCYLISGSIEFQRKNNAGRSGEITILQQ